MDSKLNVSETNLSNKINIHLTQKLKKKSTLRQKIYFLPNASPPVVYSIREALTVLTIQAKAKQRLVRCVITKRTWNVCKSTYPCRRHSQKDSPLTENSWNDSSQKKENSLITFLLSDVCILFTIRVMVVDGNQ